MHTHTYIITTTFTFICTYVITCKLPCLLLQGMVLWSFCGIPVKLGFSLGFLGILHLHNYNHMKYVHLKCENDDVKRTAENTTAHEATLVDKEHFTKICHFLSYYTTALLVLSSHVPTYSSPFKC